MDNPSFINRLKFLFNSDIKLLNTDYHYFVKKRKQIPAELRQLVFSRDKNICFYCKKTLKNQMTVDHYIPFCVVGHNDINNLVTACFNCNQLKGNINPNNLKDKLIYKKFLLKVNKDYLKNEILLIEQSFLNNEISIESLFNKSYELIQEYGNDKLFVFSYRTNRLIKRNYNDIYETWSNKIYHKKDSLFIVHFDRIKSLIIK